MWLHVFVVHWESTSKVTNLQPSECLNTSD